MSEYYTMTVKVSKEDIVDYLLNFYDEEDLTFKDLESEATQAVEGILSDHFSDYYVIDKHTICIGEF